MKFWNYLQLSIFCSLILVTFTANAKGKSYSKSLNVFSKPICAVGTPELSLSKKVKILKKYQSKISRKTEDFRDNRDLEKIGKLSGSAKSLAYWHFRNKKYTKRQREFGFFIMTLFGEARNLDEDSMAMVAKVINNRKEKFGSYVQTVTKLAQFSAWYYKNLYDNATMLCPTKKYHHLWDKVYKVAREYFNKKDESFTATNYYAPFNMSPRYRIPDWSKGKHVVGFGGHVFIVDKDYAQENEEMDVIYIPESARKLKVRHGKIKLIN